jgi:hypothetical protein
MGKLELDKWDLKRLCELHDKGRLNLQPDYQRGKVWDNVRRYDLVDTILRQWPSGLIMLRAYEKEDSAEPIEVYDVVDGQQRLTTLFDYMKGTEMWAIDAPPKLRSSFKPYKLLSTAQQTHVDEYKVAVAFMREYEVPEIQDVYSRLQTGKPLKIGERIKAMRSEYKDSLRDLSSHKLFDFNGHRFRDSQWTLATQFFKAVYSGDPLARVEFAELKTFLESKPEATKMQKAKEQTRKIMTYEQKVFSEALIAQPSFEDNISSPRTLKWLFAVLMALIDRYAITGKEHLIAKGLLAYYDAKAKEGSKEWECYLSSGRSGRMDTDDVKACLSQMMGYLLNASEADPLDTQRLFTSKQRSQIWDRSNKKCSKCGIELTKTNFHADHIKSHTSGGPTTVENGQVLCAACNFKKGGGLTSFKLGAKS